MAIFVIDLHFVSPIYLLSLQNKIFHSIFCRRHFKFSTPTNDALQQTYRIEENETRELNQVTFKRECQYFVKTLNFEMPSVIVTVSLRLPCDGDWGLS